MSLTFKDTDEQIAFLEDKVLRLTTGNDEVHRLKAENKNLWDAVNLERRLKNRLATFLENEGYDVDDIAESKAAV